MLGAVLVCVAARIGYLLYPKVNFNADEASTGLMVRDILHGHNYTFYAGQSYGGTIEQYLQAGMYEVLRLPQDRFTLRLVQVALSVASCLLVYACAGRMLPTRWHAVLAALLFAVGPWFNVVATATSQGFYVASQTLVLAALYCVLRLEASTRDDSSRLGWALGGGLCAGLAVWTAITTGYVLAPLLIWAAPLLGRRLRLWAAALLGAAVGAAPMLAWSVRHRHVPLSTFPGPKTSVPERLGNLFGPVLREFLGLSYRLADGGPPRIVQTAVVCLALGGYGYALWRRRRGLAALLTFRIAGRAAGDILLLIPPFVVLLVAASPASWYTDTPRYLITAFPFLAIALAAAVPTRRAVVPGTALVAAVCVLSLWFFVTAQQEPRIPRRERAMRTLTTLLVQDHETRIYAEYWTAIPLQYLVGDRLTVAVCIGAQRFPAAQRAVAAVPNPVYVTSTANDSDATLLETLRAHHVTYRVRSVDYLRVYDRLSPPASAAQLGV